MPESNERTPTGAPDGLSGAGMAHELAGIIEAQPTEPVEPERGEVVSTQGFEVQVNREQLAKLEGIPEGMKEWMSRLPESLSFRDPMTLIVGENGSGKTQFARALVGAFSENRIGSNLRSKPLHLEPSEPAAVIAAALMPGQPQEGNIITSCIAGSQIMEQSREWAMNQMRAREVGKAGSSTDSGLSSRQLFEQSIQIVKELRIDNHRVRVLGDTGGDVAIIFDEPEQGLSPQRQMELPQELAKFPDAGDMMLVPTNNLALYLSDLPRLDISQPERGVHRPSDFGEAGKIEFHKAQ